MDLIIFYFLVSAYATLTSDEITKTQFADEISDLEKYAFFEWIIVPTVIVKYSLSSAYATLTRDQITKTQFTDDISDLEKYAFFVWIIVPVIVIGMDGLNEKFQEDATNEYVFMYGIVLRETK